MPKLSRLGCRAFAIGRGVLVSLLEPDPKGCCVAVDCVIHDDGVHRDGERQCGRRSTAGPIGGREKGIRAICGMRSGRGWSR